MVAMTSDFEERMMTRSECEMQRTEDKKECAGMRVRREFLQERTGGRKCNAKPEFGHPRGGGFKADDNRK